VAHSGIADVCGRLDRNAETAPQENGSGLAIGSLGLSLYLLLLRLPTY